MAACFFLQQRWDDVLVFLEVRWGGVLADDEAAECTNQ